MSTAYHFGRFELHPAQRQVLADGRPQPLGQRAFDVLHALIERRDRLVGKNELLDVVWPGLVVEENNLQVQISTLRKLLGPQAIATIPGRGYRFTLPLDGAPAGPSAEPSADRVAPATGADARATAQTNLPEELPPLYGRDADVAALLALVREHRLVTVVGAGGIGKSRLAQAAAHASRDRVRDGAWMIELAGLSDPALLPNAVARALGTAIAGTDAPQAALAAALAPRTLLLVLDNCEHLSDAVAALVEDVMRAAPGVTLLTTSQEPLRLPAEHQFRIAPLEVPAATTAASARESGAVALFEARVRAVDPRFALTDENLALAIDICRRLDGLPLALELAAARVATLGPRAVRDKLDARFKLLTGGARATLRRHQTLRAALEWSYNLLDDAEKAVFRRLGVFAGGFTIETAQAVASDAAIDEWAVLDRLSALVEKSLVVMDAGDPPRYRLLESARAFALEQLAESETEATLRRHALAMRAFIERIDGANLDGELRTDQYAALVLPEVDNLRAAYAWAIGGGNDRSTAIAIAAHAGALIDYAVECARWLVPLQPDVERGAVEPAIAARYWRALAAGNFAGRVPVGVQADAAARAVGLYRELDRPRRVFSSLTQLSGHRAAQQDHAGARAALDEARRLVRPDWPPEFRIILLRRDGSIARQEGRIAEALAMHREAVALGASAGDWRLEVIGRNNLVDLLWETHSLDEAAREALDVVERLRAKPAAASDMDVLYANAVAILSEQGRVDDAWSIAIECLPVIRRTRNIFHESWMHLFWRRGALGAAARMLGAADAAAARTGQPPQPNERRLIAEVRPALAASLAPDVLASHLAAGAALDERGLLALIEETLASAPESRR